MPIKWKQENLVVFNDGTITASWFASVLNNDNGRNWIKQFRKKNPKYRVTVRARSADRKNAFLKAGRTINDYYCSSQHDCPHTSADRFVLYLDRNNRKNKLIQIGEYLDGVTFGFEKVENVYFNDGKHYITVVSYKGRHTAKWSVKTLSWRRIQPFAI